MDGVSEKFMEKKLTPAEKKKIKQAAKKAGYAPGEVLDLMVKGTREIALPIPNTLIRLIRKRRKE